MRALCVIAFLAAGSGAANADFTGRVINVSDGDTLTVLVKKTQVRVRLESIDAPESKQAFGKRSRQSLAEICANKTAWVIDTRKDSYGGTVAWVKCDAVHANVEQVRRGMAWVFDKYATAKSPLFRVEADAKRQRLGLWADPRPVPPWEWRAAKRTAAVQN